MYSVTCGRCLSACVVIRFMDVFKRQARQREADAEIDVGQGAADGVTALKHGDMRIEERVHGGVAVRGKLHIGEGIGIVVVLPRRVDHQVGFERLQQRHAPRFL